MGQACCGEEIRLPPPYTNPMLQWNSQSSGLLKEKYISCSMPVLTNYAVANKIALLGQYTVRTEVRGMRQSPYRIGGSDIVYVG